MCTTNQQNPSARLFAWQRRVFMDQDWKAIDGMVATWGKLNPETLIVADAGQLVADVLTRIRFCRRCR